ncbi:hypothetical protein GWC77_28945, partial [Paraburkholderia sp. NMBU_R16]|nr:hypothetical protein [Paraburkholderia sp. NMBU_R16]
HAPSVNQQTLVSVNQHRHHQPRRDILILFVARLSSRLSRHSESYRKPKPMPENGENAVAKSGKKTDS